MIQPENMAAMLIARARLVQGTQHYLDAISILQENPKLAGNSLAGGIGGLCAGIPEPLWREMLAKAGEPCGTPGCDCHVPNGALFPVLDQMRAAVLQVAAEEKRAAGWFPAGPAVG